jgi:hypothetical protein
MGQALDTGHSSLYLCGTMQIRLPFISKTLTQIPASAVYPDADVNGKVVIAKKFAITPVYIDSDDIVMISPFLKQPIEMDDPNDAEELNDIYVNACSSIHLAFLAAEADRGMGQVEIAADIDTIADAVNNMRNIEPSEAAIEYIRRYNEWVSQEYGEVFESLKDN